MGMKRKIKHGLQSVFALAKEKQMVPIPTPVNTNELLAGKVALITGGNGAIGAAIAKAFLNSGCKVVIAGRNEESLLEICKNSGGGCRYIILDVRDVSFLAAKICQAASLFEENRIDICVNCAGIMSHTHFLEMQEEEYDSVMDVNAKGVYFMCQAMGNYMIERKIKGHILNVSSSSSLRPAATHRISKWAVRGITLGVAEELLPFGIIVNAIAPGPVATSMMGRSEGDTLYKNGQPLGRYAMPEEIAPLAVLMVSNMGNLMVGDTYYISGGSGVLSLHK